MFQRLLSGDYPRSKVLAGILVAIFVGLAFAPFLFPGVKALNVAAKVLVFVVLVASFDLLLGYTGIVSFAHTMFFGIGAYGVAIASTRMGGGWAALGVGLLLAMLLSLALSVPLFMALWFAPALVFFNNMLPLPALKASFNACLKNTLAFVVYGLIVLVLMFFAALPVGLGFLVLIPVLAGSIYASYQDVFVAN